MKDGKLKKHSSIVQPSKSQRHCNALDVILGKYLEKHVTNYTSPQGTWPKSSFFSPWAT
jgi:hypothetical protein